MLLHGESRNDDSVGMRQMPYCTVIVSKNVLSEFGEGLPVALALVDTGPPREQILTCGVFLCDFLFRVYSTRSGNDQGCCVHNGRMDSQTTPHRPFVVLPPKHDPLKHFSREKPGWKLAALLVCRAPYIITATSTLGAVVYHLFKNW